jgi:hypothetical protein
VGLIFLLFPPLLVLRLLQLIITIILKTMHVSPYSAMQKFKHERPIISLIPKQNILISIGTLCCDVNSCTTICNTKDSRI